MNTIQKTFGIFFFLLPFWAWSQIGNDSPSQSRKQKDDTFIISRNSTHNTASPSISKFESLQDQTQYKKGFDPKRFFFGGHLGLQLGSITAVDVSPSIGYTVHRMFKVGISFTFDYLRYTIYSPTNSQTVNVFLYGGGLFIRFFPIKYIYLHAEMRGLNQPNLGNSSTDRLWVGYPFIGFGYNQPVSPKAAMQLQVLWNLNTNAQNIYKNPLINLGFNIRL